MIRHKHDGWTLAEFSREIPSGDNPRIIERFVYERGDEESDDFEFAIGYRVKGTRDIIFEKDFV